jgi:bifunctional NMN adenylyltransferase/nudix hydrolase
MIEAKFPEFIVVPIMDKKTDELWSQEVDARIADVIGAVPADVVLYGGRDSFIPYYNGIHEPHELELSNPISPSGTEVREKLTNTVMESADFRAGVIYAMHQMYPRTIPTVDVAVLHCNGDKTEVLLGRKKNEKGLRFIGGYAEPGSDRYELDGAREVMEEASREIGNFEYISSQKIDDWRYTNETDKIKTLFFMATANSLDIKAGDDIEHVEWVDIRKIKHTHFEQEHQVLVEALITNLQKKGILQ